MKKLALIILVFAGVNVSAQGGLGEYGSVTGTGGGGLRFTEIKAKPVAAKGSVYYYDNFLPGTFKLFSGETVSGMLLRYNMKTQTLEMKDGADAIKNVGIGDISEIIIAGEKMENCSNYKQKETNTGFFKEVAGKRVKLLVKTNLTVLEANYNPALDAGSRAQTYTKNSKYYVAKDGSVIPFKLRKRKVLKLFKDKQPEIEAFVKENDLKYRDEADLGKIFDYYNSL